MQEVDTASWGGLIEVIFTKARTQNAWLDRPVPATLLRKAQALAQSGPTSVNSQPARYIFLTSDSAKERLRPYLAPGNVDKTMSAPVVTIIAHDLGFVAMLPKLFPHADVRAFFEGNRALIESTAFRNGTLQGAFFMLAARSLGLDCGPLSGFDNEGVDSEFFADSNIKSNFVCNLGYGDPAALFPRSPRMTFEEVATVL